MNVKTVFSVIGAIAGITLLITAGAGFANVSAPPANQQLGMDDGIFNNLVEVECRACHDDPGITCSTSNVDRHHLNYGGVLPQGACSVTGNACLSDNGTAGCNSAICSDTFPAFPCTYDTDCPNAGLGETCGEVCMGETVAPVLDADQDGVADTVYSCLSCHAVDTGGGDISFILERDCLQCHVQVPGEGSVHHLTPLAQGLDSPIGDPNAGDCTPCHGTLVDDIGDGHFIPFYSPSLVTPSPSDGDGEPLNSRGNGAGACNYCHDSGTDNSTGIQVFTNEDTHHNTGVFLSETGVLNGNACVWCHNWSQPGEYDIRSCEGCHGYESLHNIAADSDTGCFLNPSDPSCEVVIGGEDPGYSHVGNESDCWGCHGFAMSNSPGSGPATPFVGSSDIVAITAGTDTAVTLTGSAFTNLIGTFQWLSEVALTAEDGSSLLLTPDSITTGSLTVTIPGTLAPGNYTLQAVKGDYAKSNPVVISIKPAVVITSVNYDDSEGIITINGYGFSDAPPEGAEGYINVEVDNTPVVTSSWTDTEITASVSAYQGSVNVSALFCSASFEGSSCDNCLADFNNDTKVGILDLVMMKSEYGRNDCDLNFCQSDLNSDGRVGILDLLIIKTEYTRVNCCM